MTTTDTPKTVRVAELTDTQLAQLHLHYESISDAEHQTVVDAEIHRRLAERAAGLNELQAWATSEVATKATKPHQAPAEAPDGDLGDEVPAEAPSVRDRPKSIGEVIGQKKVVGRLRMVTMGSKLRGTKMPHVLVSGPAGFGKTTLANVIAAELEANLLVTSGMVLTKPGDLVGLLAKTQGKTVMFIDEIHALPKSVQEALYSVLEDAKIDSISGTGADAVAFTRELPDLIVVGATTRSGLLTVPMRMRFGLQLTMDDYSDDELAQIITGALGRVNTPAADGEALAIATRGKGTPRCCLHLTERVLDFHAVMGAESITEGMAADALTIFGIGENGLDETDFKILRALTGRFAGRPVGLDALAQALDLDAKTLSDAYEPFLARQGYIQRTKGGRMATGQAIEFMEQVDA